MSSEFELQIKSETKYNIMFYVDFNGETSYYSEHICTHKYHRSIVVSLP